MNMMQQILHTVRLVCSFKAFRRELDAIEQLPLLFLFLRLLSFLT